MKILGLDSSGLVASVAVVEDDVLLGEFTVNYKKTHSQTLLSSSDILHLHLFLRCCLLLHCLYSFLLLLFLYF